MPRFTHAHDPPSRPAAACAGRGGRCVGAGSGPVAGELELHFALALIGGRVTRRAARWPTAAGERLSATEALALACGDAALALAA